MRAMDRIAGLESDDAAPAALSKERSGLRRISAVLNKGRIARTIKQTNPAAQQPILLLVKDPYSRVGIFRRAVNQLRFRLFVISEFLRQMKHREQMAILIESHIRSLAQLISLLVGNGQRDGHGPGRATGQTHVAADRVVVRVVQKTFER